jgi:hypothetical protein
MVCSSISTPITMQTKSVQDSPCRQALPQGRENAWVRASKSQQGGVDLPLRFRCRQTHFCTLENEIGSNVCREEEEIGFIVG